MKKKEPAILIYDVSCTVCSGTIGWIRENEIENSFIMLPCQMAGTTLRFPEIAQADCMDAMHLVLPNGTVLVGERAMPEVFLRLKHYRFVAILFKLPGSQTISRIAYRWFADRRYKLANVLSHFTSGLKKQIK